MQDSQDIALPFLPPEVVEVVESAGRRAVLRELAVDATADADFDRLAGLAATLFSAPLALVSLVERERQWFRATVGTDIRETPVGLSFCAHALAWPNDVMVVEDASADPRFRDNPLVTGETQIRFYAGAPILVAGQRIGTVCVMDRKPRSKPDEHLVSALASLAGLASSLFSLKENSRKGTIATAALVRSEERHKLALEAATIASWVWNVKSGVVDCDALLPELFGLRPATRLRAREIFLAIDERDVKQTGKRFREALGHGDDYIGEYRIKGISPARWLSARGRVIERDAEGRPVLVIGVNYDVSERKSAEERQRLLLRELNHRVKNTLATVQALASQTVRHSRQPREFLEAFSGRLQAMGAAHSLLSDHEWRGIGLAELVRLEVMPFDDASKQRIEVTGADVLLTPDQAVALGLVLHELASNALKYGSLSVPVGTVGLSWRISGAADARTLEISWAEHGGPPVMSPEHQGFGTILIRRSLEKILSSKVVHEYLPGGVSAQISIPLDATQG